jgi:hypothetical protein
VTKERPARGTSLPGMGARRGLAAAAAAALLLLCGAHEARPTGTDDCDAALEMACGPKRHSVIDCAACAGDHAPSLRKAGCDNDRISRWCAGLPPPPPPPPSPEHACTVVAGVEGKLPHRFDETAARDVGECCASCGSEPRCKFWSFKASDVEKGIACRRFASVPTQNQSSSAFVSGATPPPTAAVRLRVSGAQLLDPSGAQVRLVGFNWPPKSIYGSTYKSDAVLMKQQLPRANLARIVGVLWDNARVGNTGDGPLASGDCMTDQPPYWKESCFVKLDRAVQQCVDQKIWVILTARCEYAAGQEFDTHPERNVFHNSTLASMHATMWKHVAAHYASWPYIAAFEVLSEPRDKTVSSAVVRNFYEQSCAAAQSSDPGTPCMVGPAPYYKLWNFDTDILLRSNPNVIYTFDYFTPDDYVFGKGTSIPSYPGNYTCAALVGGNPWTAKCCRGPAGGNEIEQFDAQWTASNFARAAALRGQAEVPVFMNQWSVVHGNAEQPAPGGRYEYIRDTAQALQAMDIGWAWWTWRGGGSGWSHGSSEFVYKHSDGTIELDTKAFDAVRPFI